MKRTTGILLSILTLFLVSCDRDDWGGTSGNPNGFHLTYSISNPVSAVTRTSIPLEDEEDTIHSFYLLFFENSTGGTGMFLEAIDLKADEPSGLSVSGNISITFPEDSKLNNSTDYKMLLCANIEEYTTEPFQSVEEIRQRFEGYSENEVIHTLMKITGVEDKQDPVAEQTDNSHRIASSNLPMSASALKRANEEKVTIELTRAVSRFDVFCQAPGYELVSASIWNAYTTTTVWESIFNTFGNDRTERYYGVEANENKEIVGSLYAFENYVVSPEQNDPLTTCLIIGLRKEGSDAVEYFRTNVNATSMGQQLKRNNVYRSTVRSVNGQGEDNERGAYRKADLLIEVDINGWTLDDSGNFHEDGENILAIPTQEVQLSPLGDTREYNIFTLGEGKLEISNQELPENISVTLNKNILTITATPCSEPVAGVVTLRFGVLSGSILIKQNPHDIDFLNLNTYELPLFSSEAGHISSDIQVSASGTWVAEIYNSSYFAFVAEGDTPLTTIEGEAGETFNLQTIEDNTHADTRHCFVLVKLKDIPEVSRVIILSQAGSQAEYLTVSPNVFPTFSGGGGYTDNIIVYASGRFKAELSVNTNVAEALFVDAISDGEDDDDDSGSDGDEPEEKTYSSWDSRSNGSNTFAIRISALTALNTTAEITLTVYLHSNNSVKETFVIKQNAISSGNLIVQTRKYAKAGALFNLNRSNTNRYVFNLATNMRNQNLFGPTGTVNATDGYVFSSKVAIQDITHIFQVTGSMSASQGRALKTWMDGSDRRFAFVTHNAGYASTSATRLNANFGTNYAVIDPNISATSSRYFNKNIDLNHPLIAYLLNGRFGTVTPGNISLNGKSVQNRGLTKWPDTFVPIIMGISETSSTRGQEVCLFGIDPVMRIIWITDPAIFGSKNTKDSNSMNYPAGSDHERLLNNFIAWLTEAATYGDDFLDRFR